MRGPQVMKGYWNRPEESERALKTGFLHTGDLGAMDEAGFLSLTGRLKEIIFCGGFNIYPKNIEDALHEHPAVAEAAVIGVPDKYLVEMPKAFVVLHPAARDVTSREIRRFIAAKLSKHEMPASVEIWESLPKTAAGKNLQARYPGAPAAIACGPALSFLPEKRPACGWPILASPGCGSRLG